jgi:hypothetical protein
MQNAKYKMPINMAPHPLAAIAQSIWHVAL